MAASTPDDETRRETRPADEGLRRLRPPFHMAAEMGGELGRGALLLGPLPARQGAAYCAACWSFGGALNCCVQRAFVESTTVTSKGLPASGL